MFDLAAHTLGGAYGVTHGRTYKGAKTNSLVESSFGTAKLLFDTTPEPYQSLNDIGPTFFSASEQYRLPEVIRRVAVSTDVVRIRERHGVHLDPHEPISLVPPQGAYGYDYSEKNLPFWWSHGALTAWQLLPTTLAAAKKWNLFDTELFQEFKAVEPLLDLNPGVAQVAVRELAPFAAAGVLGEAHTYTWRSPDAMLSSVIDHRFGDAMDQTHAWQATLDPQAVVFTTHPTKDVPASTDWGDDNGYWTGTASMPRSAQRDRVAIHLYRPGYASPSDPLLGPIFAYQPFTHAFFPQDRFDEVVEQSGWVFGRKGDGYVALHSERPTQWRVYDPATEATNGFIRPFDLVAPGGADNAWIVEVGRAADHGSFGQFVAAITAAPLTITRSGARDLGPLRLTDRGRPAVRHAGPVPRGRRRHPVARPPSPLQPLGRAVPPGRGLRHRRGRGAPAAGLHLGRTPRDVSGAEHLEAIRHLKARYFRLLDTKDWDASRRGLHRPGRDRRAVRGRGSGDLATGIRRLGPRGVGRRRHGAPRPHARARADLRPDGDRHLGDGGPHLVPRRRTRVAAGRATATTTRPIDGPRTAGASRRCG